MKRRTFSGGRKKSVMKTDKRKALEEKVLEQMRETRKTIDPEILARFRDVIRESQLADAAIQPAQVAEHAGEEYELIDRRKTYETILKFAKLRQDNQAFMNEIFRVLGSSPKH